MKRKKDEEEKEEHAEEEQHRERSFHFQIEMRVEIVELVRWSPFSVRITTFNPGFPQS